MPHGIVARGDALSFSATHFIVEHDKCERLHGHNYQVKVELEGSLDEKGMIMDFRLIKDIISNICDALDHRVIIPENSKLVKIAKKGKNIEINAGKKFYSFPEKDCVLIPTESTTAEHLAEFIFKQIKTELEKKKMSKRIKATRVFVAESSGSEAFYGT